MGQRLLLPPGLDRRLEHLFGLVGVAPVTVRNGVDLSRNAMQLWHAAVVEPRPFVKVVLQDHAPRTLVQLLPLSSRQVSFLLNADLHIERAAISLDRQLVECHVVGFLFLVFQRLQPVDVNLILCYIVRS